MSTIISISEHQVRTQPIAAPPLRVSFSWTLAGNAVYAITQFGMLSVLAKLGSAAVVGQYALALAISAPVFMFTNLQLRGVQATDACDEYEFADYFSLRCLSTAVGVLTIALIALLAGYDADTKVVILLVAIAKAVETFSDVIAGHLQKFERLDQVARALMIRGLASVFNFSAVFFVTRNLIISLSVLSLTWLATIGLYDFRVLARVLTSGNYFCFSGPILRKLVWLSLPLGVVMALNSLSTNIPRYILERKLGTAELGVFASLAYLVTAMSLISIALGQSVTARLSRLFAAGELNAFRSLTGKLLLLAAGLGMGGVAIASMFGRPVLTFVYRPEYAEQVNLLIVMVVDASVTAASIFLGFAMTAARCFRAQITIMIVNLVVTIVCTFLLLPHFGLLGAGYALLSSSLVQASTSYLVLDRAIQNRSRA